MTESWLGVGICSLDDDETHRCETSGHPSLANEVRIIDLDTGEEAPVNVEGELQVRGRRYRGSRAAGPLIPANLHLLQSDIGFGYGPTSSPERYRSRLRTYVFSSRMVL